MKFFNSLFSMHSKILSASKWGCILLCAVVLSNTPVFAQDKSLKYNAIDLEDEPTTTTPSPWEDDPIAPHITPDQWTCIHRYNANVLACEATHRDNYRRCNKAFFDGGCKKHADGALDICLAAARAAANRCAAGVLNQ